MSKLYMDGTKLNRHLEEVVKWQKEEWFAPLHLEISITNVCNQHCTFCYIDWSHGKEKMSEEMLTTLIRDAKKLGVKSALIAGEGEPTINKAYIKGIEEAGKVGLDVALNTNAVSMNEEELERILPYTSWMRCSVQAAEPELYAQLHKTKKSDFEKAINNIKKAVEIKKRLNLDVTIGIQQVLLQENGHNAADLAQLAKDIGVDYYVIKPCHPHEYSSYNHNDNLVQKFKETLKEAESKSDDNFKAVIRWNFLSESKRVYSKCRGIAFIAQINSKGEVLTCYPMGDKKEHVYGSLASSSLEEILKSNRYKQTIKWVENNVDVSKCMPTCRQHNVNNYLHWLEEEPQHINFI